VTLVEPKFTTLAGSGRARFSWRTATSSRRFRSVMLSHHYRCRRSRRSDVPWCAMLSIYLGITNNQTTKSVHQFTYKSPERYS
jgi:hypothetical protein